MQIMVVIKNPKPIRDPMIAPAIASGGNEYSSSVPQRMVLIVSTVVSGFS